MTWAFLRDVLLFVGGLALVGSQVAVQFQGGTPDAGVLFLAAGMMGLPAVIRGESGKGGGKDA